MPAQPRSGELHDDPDDRPDGRRRWPRAAGVAVPAVVLAAGVAFAWRRAEVAERERAAEWRAGEVARRVSRADAVRDLTAEAAAELADAFAADPAGAAWEYQHVRWRFVARVDDAGPGDAVTVWVLSGGVGPATTTIPAGLDWAGAARGEWFMLDAAVERFALGGGVRFVRAAVSGPADPPAGGRE